MADADKETWIFLSHSNEDYEKVRKVRDILENMKTRPLMFFLKCLNDEDEIEDLIKREIEARTRFILCDSENSRKSLWVSKEIEYIKTLNKPYDIIDISADESVIQTSLKNCLRKESLFISYSRSLQDAIRVVNHRLDKYDFYSTFIDINHPFTSGANFIEEIENNIRNAISNGKFIPVLSASSIESQFCQYELQRALELDMERTSILPIFLDEASKNQLEHVLRNYEHIDLSKAVTPHNGLPNAKDIPHRYGSLENETQLKKLGDDIANAILVRLQGYGNLITYAENFRHGKGLKKDIEEANKLAGLIEKHKEKVDCNNRLPHGAC